MYRYIFSFSCLLLFCFLVSPFETTLAVPILKGTAKNRPQIKTTGFQPTARLARSAYSTQIMTLGVRGNISSVKQKPYTKNYTSAYKSSLSSFFQKGIIRRITSKSVMILDAHSGKTIFAKAPDNPRQPASTIKVLTGMIAMKRLRDNEKVHVSRHAEAMPSSKVYLSTKKQYKANDLINAVLLASANDASVALAEKIAGSEPAFAKLMTLHANLWGAKNTICRTASGLTARGQQSTARDLAEIFRRAMQDKEFAQRMKKTRIKTSYGKTLYNHNKALWQVEGAMAGKTGYTNKARQTYVGQFKRGNDAIVVAIMGSETMWTDIKRLVEYGFKRKKQIKLAQLEFDTKASQVQ
ncbi:MAG: D-alanyl-D-alanine carboxypeptidase [Candidatus Electrothrix sp. AR3]|nr:D-alanyl-D-alanine carboxypeptidase [Candidatus Electrothrix sp. AR3]